MTVISDVYLYVTRQGLNGFLLILTYSLLLSLLILSFYMQLGLICPQPVETLVTIIFKLIPPCPYDAEFFDAFFTLIKILPLILTI